MRKKLVLVSIVVALGLALGFGLYGRSGRAALSPREAAAPRAAATRPTPADTTIRKGEAVIKALPDSPDGYNLLAGGYMQKARETGDFTFNTLAESTLAKSLEVAPGNFDAILRHAALLVAYHRFAEGLAEARRAEQMEPESPDVYGVITDACVELGDYSAAKQAAEKMMNLRPGSDSYARLAHLGSLHGDNEAAIEIMALSLRSANPRDPEGVAWLRVHLGKELMKVGMRPQAEREYDLALAKFPDYHIALAAKAHARAAAGDYTAAVELYKRALERVPLAETAIALGDLYAKLGQEGEARRQYDLAEVAERSGSNGNAESAVLARLWADHDTRLDEALEIARRQRASRSDIATCDLLAWCLYKKGQLADAQAAMDEALRLGTRDALLYYHAGMIAHSLGDHARAAKHLKAALEIDPAFSLAEAETARRALNSIGV
jgi:tetratricopeptide (TPR) repeat protein